MKTAQTTYRKLDKLLAKFMAAMNGAALAEGFTLAATTAKGRTVLEVTQNDAAGASRVLMRVEAQVARPAAPVPPAKREQLALALPMEPPAVPAVEPPAVEPPAVDPLAPGQRIMRCGDAVFEHVGDGSKMWTIDSIEGSTVGLSWWSERRTVARESIVLGPADLWRLASDAPAVAEARAVNLYRNGITPAELMRLTPAAIAELDAIHATRLVSVNLSNNDQAWPLWWFETPFDGSIGSPVAKALHDWYARHGVAPLARLATRGDDERIAIRAEAGHALTVAEAHREAPDLVEAQKSARKRRKAEKAEEKRAKAALPTPPPVDLVTPDAPELPASMRDLAALAIPGRWAVILDDGREPFERVDFDDIAAARNTYDIERSNPSARRCVLFGDRLPVAWFTRTGGQIEECPSPVPEKLAPRMVRVWIEEPEWDALDEGMRGELEEPIGGTVIEWEGRAGWVTALVPDDETLRALHAAAKVWSAPMFEGDDAPPSTKKAPTKKAPTKKPAKVSTKKPSTKGSKARRA